VVGFAKRYDAQLNVIHRADHSPETTEKLIDRAEEFLEEKGASQEVDVYFDVWKFRRFSRIGTEILEVAEQKDVDHIVMDTMGQVSLVVQSSEVLRGRLYRPQSGRQL
jgi:nucleotide-binding universal stress UspA family protein